MKRAAEEMRLKELEERVENYVATQKERGVLYRLRVLVMETDTTPTKVSLFLYAALISIAFWQDGGSCDLRLCKLFDDLTSYIGGWKFWGVTWTLYAAIKGWRILDHIQRPELSLVINLIGAILFGMMAASAVLARWPDWLISVPYLVLAAAALWVFARTAIHPGAGFRGD